MANIALKYSETNLVGEVVNIALTATGLTVYAQFKDSKTNVARTPDASANLFTLDKDTQTFEMILADSHSTTGGVTTIVINAAGRNLNEYKEGTGGATGLAHAIGAEIGCVEVQAPVGTLNKIMDGTNNTTGENFRVGNAADNDITYYFQNGDANPPFVRYDSANNKCVYSNDGTSTLDMGGGTGSITAGDGIDIAAGVVSTDIKANSGLQITATELDLDIRSNYGLLADSNGLYIDLDTTPGLEFNSGKLRAKVKTAGGITRDADGLSIATDADLSHTETFVAGESITADDTLALAPLEVRWGASMSEGTINLGAANTARRYAVKVIPKMTVTGFDEMKIVGKESAASTMTLTATIETDNAGEPSGTPVANGTSNGADTSGWGAAYAERTISWGTGVNLVQGTTYWIVLSVDATDAVNYVQLAANTNYEEHMITFARLTYDLDAGTWGGASAQPFYFYFDDSPNLGEYVMKCDADYGGRTWRFIGFAETTVSAEEDVTVFTDYASALSGLVPGKDYYISATAGEITITAPDGLYGGINQYKIGRALSTTELKIEPGEKRINYHTPSVITATTTYNIATFVKPRRVDATAAWNSISIGYFDENGNFSVYKPNGAVASGDTTNCISTTDGAGNDFDGVGTLDDVGIKLVMTETGAAQAHLSFCVTI